MKNKMNTQEMDELFLPHELAVIAEEKGFNEDCFSYYKPNGLNYNVVIGRFDDTDHRPAPTHQQIIKWLIDTRNISLNVLKINTNWYWEISNNSGVSFRTGNSEPFNNYYDCLNKVIGKVLETITKK